MSIFQIVIILFMLTEGGILACVIILKIVLIESIMFLTDILINVYLKIEHSDLLL